MAVIIRREVALALCGGLYYQTLSWTWSSPVQNPKAQAAHAAFRRKDYRSLAWHDRLCGLGYLGDFRGSSLLV